MSVMSFGELLGQSLSVSFGGGLTVAKTFGKNEYDGNIKPKLGLGLSSGLEYFPIDKLSLQLEVGYEEKGRRVVLSEEDFFRSTFKYLTISLYPKLYLSKNRNLFFGFGFYGGHLLGQRSIYDDGSKGDLTSLFKRFDFGLKGALGVKIPLSKSIAIGFEEVFNLGLFDTDEQSDLGEFRHASLNSVLKIHYNF